MRKIEFLEILIILHFLLILSCASIHSENQRGNEVGLPSPTATVQIVTPVITDQNVKPATNDVLTTCSELGNLTKIPYEAGEAVDDPVYNSLMAKGKEAIPCLIEKIPDITVIDDPRIGDPHIHGFTIGDAAVFLLSEITTVPIKQSLPPEIVKNQWEAQGIYSYFEYVEKPANRKKLQLWWRNWYKENFAR